MDAIIKGDKKGTCFLCGRNDWIEIHHIFNGTANRKKSEKYGLTVHLCHWCHNEPPNGAHYNQDADTRLKQIGQKAAMNEYGWTVDEFREVFGKNYL